ncbi:MAG: cysteine synthase family protein [Acidobacteria bacterium]|nr:MAG: cysteine synthase family protein [Acidobacteriota bacterium]
MSSVLDAIGNTPLVELRRMSPPGGARIVMKLESANPTGSMKDRMARAMIEGAEASGKLRPGREIVEFTGGSTGTSLAFVAAAKGYPISIVTSDAFSLEKRNHMKAFGAKMTIEPCVNGMVTPDLFVRMRAATERIVAERNAFWTQQFENHDQTTGYYALADEAWAQSGQRIDAFVHAVGTCGSLRGTSTRLRQLQPDVKVYAVEPSTSAVMSGGAPGAHRMEGMGTGRLVPMWDPSLADGIETVSTEDAEAMARRLAKEEAIFAGTSTGANLVAALRIASRMRPDSTVLIIAVDHGLKYVTTELYR